MKVCKFLPEYENLYYGIAYDIGFINSDMCDDLKNIQIKKAEIMKKGVKSIAEFDREFEQTEEFITHKKYKYEIEGLEKMMAGVRVKIESLKAETRGQY